MLFELLRIKQWYKNLLVFLPLIFVGLATEKESLFLTFLAFFALCCMSSVNYILNDILDRKKDSIHSEKKQRPIAAGEISIPSAGIIAALLAITSLVIGIALSTQFFLLLLVFFFLTFIYSTWAKEELFLDLIFISINFVLRAMAGAYVLHVRMSPWLIVCTFFLSFFIAIAKRKADIMFLKENAQKHKIVLKDYSPEIINLLMAIATSVLILSYSLYSFLSIYPHLIYTLPFSLYVILRYFYLAETGSAIVRKPENFYKDTRLILGILAWCIAVVNIIYFV